MPFYSSWSRLFFSSIGLQRNFTQQTQIILGTISFTWQTTRSTEIRRTLNRTQIQNWQGWDFQKMKTLPNNGLGFKVDAEQPLEVFTWKLRDTEDANMGRRWLLDYYHITRWLWCREFNSYGAPSLFLSQWKISLSRVFCLQKQHCKKSTNRWVYITLYKKLAKLGRCGSLIHLILKKKLWKIITIFGLRALGHARVGLVKTWKF